MAELKDLLNQIRDLNPDAETFATQLKEISQPLYQVVFNRGHSTATASNGDKVTQLETQLAAANTRATQLTTDLENERKKTPDVAAVREQYEGQVAQLQQQLKDANKAHKTEVKDLLHSAQVAAVKVKLAGRLDADYIDIQAEKHKGRIQVADDRKVTILQDGQNIPIASDDPVAALADEIVQKSPAKFVLSSVGAGGGSNNGSGAGAGAGGGKDVFSRVREDAKKTQIVTPPGKSATEKLGMTATT